MDRYVVDAAAADQDIALGRFQQPGYHAQRRRLATARGPKEGYEAALGHIQIGAVHSREVAKALDDPAQFDRVSRFLRHQYLSSGRRGHIRATRRLWSPLLGADGPQ